MPETIFSIDVTDVPRCRRCGLRRSTVREVPHIDAETDEITQMEFCRMALGCRYLDVVERVSKACGAN